MLGWGESRESDNVLNSLGRIFQISMHGWHRRSRVVHRPEQGGQAFEYAFDCPHFSAPSDRGTAVGRAQVCLARQRRARKIRAAAQNAAITPAIIRTHLPQ